MPLSIILWTIRSVYITIQISAWMMPEAMAPAGGQAFSLPENLFFHGLNISLPAAF